MASYNFNITHPTYSLALEVESKSRRLIERLHERGLENEKIENNGYEEFKYHIQVIKTSVALNIAENIVWQVEERYSRVENGLVSKKTTSEILERFIDEIQQIKEKMGCYTR